MSSNRRRYRCDCPAGYKGDRCKANCKFTHWLKIAQVGTALKNAVTTQLSGLNNVVHYCFNNVVHYCFNNVVQHSLMKQQRLLKKEKTILIEQVCSLLLSLLLNLVDKL